MFDKHSYMETKELRIGNYLQSLSIVQVNSLSSDQINGYYSSGFSPIPLTGDILLKCGFEKNENTYYHELFMFNNGVLRVIADNYRTTGKDVRIEFLHQLQNIYFALTGKELEVKP